MLGRLDGSVLFSFFICLFLFCNANLHSFSSYLLNYSFFLHLVSFILKTSVVVFLPCSLYKIIVILSAMIYVLVIWNTRRNEINTFTRKWMLQCFITILLFTFALSTALNSKFFCYYKLATMQSWICQLTILFNNWLRGGDNKWFYSFLKDTCAKVNVTNKNAF